MIDVPGSHQCIGGVEAVTQQHQRSVAKGLHGREVRQCGITRCARLQQGKG